VWFFFINFKDAESIFWAVFLHSHFSLFPFSHRQRRVPECVGSFIKRYRRIQMLHQLYSELCSPLMIPLQNVILLIFILFTNFCCIELRGKVQWIYYMLFPLLSICNGIFQLVYTPMAGSLSAFSMPLQKRSIRSTRSSFYLFRSCAPLKVRAGYFYAYNKYTVVKVMGAIIVGTSRIIILAHK